MNTYSSARTLSSWYVFCNKKSISIERLILFPWPSEAAILNSTAGTFGMNSGLTHERMQTIMQISQKWPHSGDIQRGNSRKINKYVSFHDKNEVNFLIN